MRNMNTRAVRFGSGARASASHAQLVGHRTWVDGISSRPRVLRSPISMAAARYTSARSPLHVPIFTLRAADELDLKRAGASRVPAELPKQPGRRRFTKQFQDV